MIEYWHWHTLHFGTETYWGGVLPHSGRPGRTYARAVPPGRGVGRGRRPRRRPRPRTPTSRSSTRCRASGSCRSTRRCRPPDGGPDAAPYHGIFDPFYRGAFDAGRQVRILHAGQLHDPSGERAGPTPESAGDGIRSWSSPALYIADDATLDWLAAYAAAGGHLVLGPRTGYADHEARARTEPAPGTAGRGGGGRYDEFSNLGATSRSVPPRAGRSTCRTARRRRAGPTGYVVDADVLVELRPSALRPLAGDHHPPPRRGPGHLCRHGARTRSRPGPRRMAGAAADRRMGRLRLRSRRPPAPPRTGAESTSCTTGAGSPPRRDPVPLTDALNGARSRQARRCTSAPGTCASSASAGTEAAG